MFLLVTIFIELCKEGKVKPLNNGHPWDLRKVAVGKRCLIKLRFYLAVGVYNWPLLTGGRYSQVVVNSGLTVISF